MPTGDKETRIYNKMLMSESKLGTHFLVFLHNLVNDLTQSSFLSSGTLSDKKIGLTSSTNDTFSLDLTDAQKVLTGGCYGCGGHIVDLSLASSALITDYPFENANSVTYYVGILYQQVPDGIELNPRTGEPEYPYNEESFGEKGDPDSVTDGSTYIRLVINTILESSVDHSGRPVRVWLKNPVSPIESVAYYDGVVSYSSPNNYVDIPYGPGAGPLGQTSPTFPISLTASDYEVHVKGVSWFKNTDLRNEDEYAFIGTILGNGPSAIPTGFDISDQKAALALSLDRAYRANSTTSPAPGRLIDVDSWAVVFRQIGSTQQSEDPWNAPFIINRLDETQDGGQSIVNAFSWQSVFTYGGMTLRNLADAASGGYLQPQEPANFSTGSNVITLTRVGVDLSSGGSKDIGGALGAQVLAAVNGSTNNGLYLCTVTSTNTLTAETLDGGAWTFTTEVGQVVRFFIPLEMSKFYDPLITTYSEDKYYFEKYFYAYGNGLRLSLSGDAIQNQKWFVADCKEKQGLNSNQFWRVLPGRMLLRGGGSRISQGIPGGYPRYGIDVRDETDLDSAWTPDEGDDWGFDYRAQDYNKSTSNDIPAYHLTSSFRHPMWYYDSGSDDYRVEEAFNRIDAETLNLTRGGIDIRYLPGDDSSPNPDTSCGNAWVLAEVEFDTPGSADGTYWVKDVDYSTSYVKFMKYDGTTPSFPAGTGKVRFYGGMFTGPNYGNYGNTNVVGWLQTLTAPTEDTGALKINHPWGGWQLICANASGGNFGIKDGYTFATAITTRSFATIPTMSPGDASFVDHYSDNTHLNATSGYVLRLPSGSLASTFDVVLPESGTWTYDYVIGKFRGLDEAQPSPGYEKGWEPASIFGNVLQDLYTVVSESGVYILNVTPPDGCTINSVSIYVLPIHTNLGLIMYRQAFGTTTSVDLGSAVYPATTTLQTLTYTCTQNNTNVDNTSYEYKIGINSGTGINGHEIYGIKINVTVSALGRSWFKCI